MEELTLTEAHFCKAVEAMATIINRINAEHGFNDLNPNKGEMIALIHSELSEALEGIRKPGPDHHCPEFTSEEIEMADAVIRILHYSARFDLRLGPALVAKVNFNRTRPYKHGKAF